MEKSRADVECYHDIMVIGRDKAFVRSRLLTTDETFTFDGWTPKFASSKVEKLLEKYTCWYELTDPDEDDDVPVRLQNKKFFAPIEFITEMYSLQIGKRLIRHLYSRYSISYSSELCSEMWDMESYYA